MAILIIFLPCVVLHSVGFLGSGITALHLGFRLM